MGVSPAPLAGAVFAGRDANRAAPRTATPMAGTQNRFIVQSLLPKDIGSQRSAVSLDGTPRTPANRIAGSNSNRMVNRRQRSLEALPDTEVEPAPFAIENAVAVIQTDG